MGICEKEGAARAVRAGHHVTADARRAPPERLFSDNLASNFNRCGGSSNGLVCALSVLAALALAPAGGIPSHMPMTIAEARAKAEEMKAKAAAKRAAKEAAAASGAAPPVAVDSGADAFLIGEHNLILIDWDDTLFPTSAWKHRLEDGSLRASKIATLSEAISNLIKTLQQFGDVKIVTHGTKGWFQQSSKVLLPDTKALLDGLDHRYRDSHGGKYMRKNPSGQKYTTDIGVQVDNYGEWFKTDRACRGLSNRLARRSLRTARCAPHTPPRPRLSSRPRVRPLRDALPPSFASDPCPDDHRVTSAATSHTA